MPALRIAIAEDAVLLREGLASLLERFGHRVVASAGDADALLAAVTALTSQAAAPTLQATAVGAPNAVDPVKPVDIVVADVRMPPAFTDEGLRAALTLRARIPGLAVLVLSQYVEQTYAAELLDSGTGAGVGYLLKDRVGEVREFVDAVERVAAGGTVVDPEVVRQLLSRRRTPLTRLTPREREVLALVAEGRSNSAIARRLVVTEAAVSKHIAAILTKLDLPPAEDDNRRVLAVLTYLRDA